MMTIRRIVRMAKWLVSTGPRFECPCCGFRGRFIDVNRSTGRRFSAVCPRCDALERHRLQALVLDRVRIPAGLDILHFAPEAFLRHRLSAAAKSYATADIERSDVDHRVDVQSLPFDDSSFDLVYASHVMEHVQDERLGLSEIARVLRPGGYAILPVPIVRDITEEYSTPNPEESMHWRAPGLDYFDRLRDVFPTVEVFESHMFDEAHQPWIIKPSGRVGDYVPVCRA